MKRRKIIAAIVLLGGVVLFFVIISAPASSGTPFVTAKAGQGGAGSLDYTVNASGSAAAGSGGDQSGAGGGNLTDAMIQNYAQNILQMNNGFVGANTTGTNSVSFPSVNNTSQMIAQAISQQLPYKTYTNTDIHITSDNSSSSQMQYINAVTALIRKDLGSFEYSVQDMISSLVSQNNDGPINQYIGISGRVTGDILALSVPSSISDIALGELDLWSEKNAVFSAIADWNNDPAKAIVGVNQISDLVSKERSVSQLIQQRLNILGL